MKQRIFGWRRSSVQRFEEFPGTWDQACSACTGWSSAQILDKVLASSLAVHEGRAKHERDGVLLPKLEHAWSVLAGTMWQAAQDGGELRVLDLGGSLGSTYRQCLDFTRAIRTTSWAVVEQENYALAGRKNFADDILSFHTSVPDAVASVAPNVILCSGTLNYLEKPYEMLDKLAATGARTMILDRVAVHDGNEDIVAIQHVPEKFYNASLPLRIFSVARLQERLDHKWAVVADFPALDGKMRTTSGRKVRWIGNLLHR